MKTLDCQEIKEELLKASSLAARGLASNYILMTNAYVTAQTAAELSKAFLHVPGIKNFAVYGGEWVTRVIHESARLRSLIPRVYGLGDLSQILDERAYCQAGEVLSGCSEEMSKFVKTHAFYQAEKAISQHGFVLLLGEPAAGKTTIASALAMDAIDMRGYQTIKAQDANDFKRHWNPHEFQQFFWVDDAFGTIQLDFTLISGWNRIWSEMTSAVRRGTRILFTSRTYLYRSAKQYLKESAFPLLLESQVVISTENLSTEEKEQILYNHIKLGNQSRGFKRKIKPFLPNITANRHFSPEIARRLGNLFFTQHLTLSTTTVNDFVEKPIPFLVETIKTLDSNYRAALALIFMRRGNLKSPISLDPRERETLEFLGSTSAGIREALNALNHSLIFYSFQDGIYYWCFKHPTIQDAFSVFVANEPELLDIYLAGTSIQRLVEEVTCGDITLLGVRVIVPKNRYQLIIQRLNAAFHSSNLDIRLIRFLAYRCDQCFLKCYLKKNPNFLQCLSFLSHCKNYFRLRLCPKVSLVIKLHRFGLLKEKYRKKFVAEVAEITLNTPDDSFISKDFRQLFTKTERKNLLENVRLQVLPALNHFFLNRCVRYRQRKTMDKQEYLNDLYQTLNHFKMKFKKDEVAIMEINAAMDQIDEILFELSISTTEWEDYEKIKEWDSYSKLPLNRLMITNNERSIFDDVDL